MSYVFAGKNLFAVSDQLKEASIEELRLLNQACVALLNHRTRSQAIEAGRSFNLGDRVTFKDKRGIDQFGTVTKVNGKTLNVNGDNGVPWRVSTLLVTRVEGQGLVVKKPPKAASPAHAEAVQPSPEDDDPMWGSF
jgi:hypothetical protein